MNQSYKIRTCYESVGNLQEEPITIQSTGYIKFLDVEPPWESLRPHVKHIVFDCESKEPFYSPRDFSKNYLGLAKPLVEWSTVKNYCAPDIKVERSITQEENIKFHTQMSNLYQGVKSHFVRYFDTKNKSHYWLIPEKTNEPTFDAIYVLNSSQEGSADSQTESKPAEVWLIQFTVADKHTVKEIGLERAKKVLQEIMGSNVIIRFIFIVPTGQKTLNVLEKENLLRHKIPYRICEFLQPVPYQIVP
jgi:hypothetical protein